MTTPSNLWGDEWGRAPRRLPAVDQMLSRRRARRMSRRFAGVGVGIAAARLQEIAAGGLVAPDEMVDVDFALAAIEIKRADRLAKIKRNQRRSIQWLIVAGMVLTALNLLVCMAYVFVTLALHESPF
jgi:hypothetical protein